MTNSKPLKLFFFEMAIGDFSGDIVPHTLMAPGHISLAYLIDFRMIKLYLLPIRWQNMKEVAISSNFINLKLYECKTSFEFLLCKNLRIPF